MKQKLILSIFSLVLLGSVLVPNISMAQSASSTSQINSISSLLQQIQALQSQIDALKASQKTLQDQAATQLVSFVNNLSVGSQGDDVKALQALLAANPNIYPEGIISGYFGQATERAIKKLQKENGIEQAGSVGPKTRALLNQLLGKNPIAFERNEKEGKNASTTIKRGEGSDDRRPCAIVPPGQLIAPGLEKKEGEGRRVIPPCQVLPKGIEKKIDGDWNRPTTTPVDRVAPEASNIIVSNIGSTTATITWNSNESAGSRFWYSTTSPMTEFNSKIVELGGWRTAHTYTLSNLTASTTYYYMIRLYDSAGNIRGTDPRSFMTLSN